MNDKKTKPGKQWKPEKYKYVDTTSKTYIEELFKSVNYEDLNWSAQNIYDDFWQRFKNTGKLSYGDVGFIKAVFTAAKTQITDPDNF